jgi:hypothetical protein
MGTTKVLPPPRVRVYGVLLTRRAYMRLVTAGVIGLGVVLVVWFVLYVETAPPDPNLLGQSTWFIIWAFLRSYIPVILIVAGLLEALEVTLVLRRFRAAEAEQARTQQPTVNKGS